MGGTAGHPFYVEDRGWTDAGDLLSGDLHVSDDGTLIEITALDTDTRIAIVHNLTVDVMHTYYVLIGNEATLVHNCGRPTAATRAAADEMARDVSGVVRCAYCGRSVTPKAGSHHEIRRCVGAGRDR